MSDLLDAQDSLRMSIDKLLGITDLMKAMADGAYFKSVMVIRLACVVGDELERMDAQLDLLDKARREICQIGA